MRKFQMVFVLLRQRSCFLQLVYYRDLVKDPHVAGTPADFEQADMLRQFWLDNGLDVAVTTPYNILLSYPDDTKPNNVFVKTTDGTLVHKSADYEQNLTAEERPWEFPFPYLGYSGNGTVEARFHTRLNIHRD